MQLNIIHVMDLYAFHLFFFQIAHGDSFQMKFSTKKNARYFFYCRGRRKIFMLRWNASQYSVQFSESCMEGKKIRSRYSPSVSLKGKSNSYLL